MIDRAIQSLLQRTRPPSTPPHYDRAPAGRAPAGGGGGGGVRVGRVQSTFDAGGTTIPVKYLDPEGSPYGDAVTIATRRWPDVNHATGSGSAPLEACIPVIEQGDDIPVRFPGELGEPTCAIAFTNVGKCET